MPTNRRPDGAYHHGDLRAALVTGASEVLAEVGLPGFSVAQVARRTGVSSAAPYRHFNDREALLATAVEQAASRLTMSLRAAADGAGTDPGERLAVAAGAYTQYVLTRGVGLDVLYLAELKDHRFAELHARTRALMDMLVQLGLDASVRPERLNGTTLLSQVMAAAHGYATLVAGGLTPGTAPLSVDEAVERSIDAARTLVAGERARYG